MVAVSGPEEPSSGDGVLVYSAAVALSDVPLDWEVELSLAGNCMDAEAVIVLIEVMVSVSVVGDDVTIEVGCATSTRPLASAHDQCVKLW